MPENSYLIRAVSGPGVCGRCILSHSNSVTFGRNGENDFVISGDPGISRRHFQIEFESDKYWIKDLGSRNGTYVNEQSVEICELKHHDEIRAGGTRLEFAAETDPAIFGRNGKKFEARSHLMIMEDETTTIATNSDLASRTISKTLFQSEPFLSEFLKLPGKAIIATDSSAHWLRTETTIPSEFVNEHCCVALPNDLSALQMILSKADQRKILLIHMVIPREKITQQIQNSYAKFRSSNDFFSEYQELPTEIGNALVNGMDLIIGDTLNHEQLSVLFGNNHRHWLSKFED